MMDRRAFIGSLALGTLAMRSVIAAQPARKLGILGRGATSDLVGPDPRNPAANALLRGLGELGYV
jgi:hypothetical protein